ncbi:hydroxymethylbilane synthase [Oligoflexaceae bacterium]|nr:hydroxymethylbilane synthase [Oligoflexaceae bacterium]
MKELTIATRGSRLALWQAHHIGKSLKGCSYKILEVSTQGDRVQDRYLHEIGGKGLFVKEVEKALLDGRADIAVHSLKDMPVQMDPSFCLAAIPKRHARGDLIVFNSKIKDKSWSSLSSLKIGTSSLRRHHLLKANFGCRDVVMLRGNIDTRLRKLNDGEYDAIVLAEAATERLQLDLPHSLVFESNLMIPSACQGALAVQSKLDYANLGDIQKLDDPVSHEEINIERALLKRLGGDCTMPCGISVQTFEHNFKISAVVIDGEGLKSQIHFEHPCDDPEGAVSEALNHLEKQGLAAVMKSLGLSYDAS